MPSIRQSPPGQICVHSAIQNSKPNGICFLPPINQSTPASIRSILQQSSSDLDTDQGDIIQLKPSDAHLSTNTQPSHTQ